MNKVLDLLPGLVLILDINQNIVADSKSFDSEQTFVGKSIDTFINEIGKELLPTLSSNVASVFASQTAFANELEPSKGFFIMQSVHPLFGKHSEFTGVAIRFTDITQRIQDAKNLEKKSFELQLAQEISKVGSWSLDLQTNQVLWSNEMYKMYNREPEQGPPPFEESKSLFTEKGWAKLSASLDTLLKTGEPYNIEVETHDGWVLACGRIEKNTKGEFIAARGISQDITDRVKLLETADAHKRFADKIAENSPSGIYIYDLAHGTNTFMNAQYTNILGYTLDEVNAMSQDEFVALFHPDDIDNVLNHIGELAQGIVDKKIEYRFKHKEGHWVWCYSVDSPFHIDENGKVLSFIGVFIDITEKKQVEVRLEEAIKEANAANLLKSQFLANMSHEIRTPMNWLVGFADLLREDLDSDTRNEYVDLIEGASNQLLNLISDIIDVSKIEAGELEVKPSPCNLNEVFRNVQAGFNEIKESKNKDHIEITLSTPEDAEKVLVEADGLRLGQILTNLVGNALKFTHEGAINLGYSIDNEQINAFVKDNGIGIPKEKQDLVFERFGRVENARKRYDGTGLGLTICKGLIELMGGSISLESDIGKGTTFRFHIPYGKVDTEGQIVHAKDINKSYDWKGKSVLVVEDEEPSILYFKTLLKGMCDLHFASNGQDAIDFVKINPDIDLILMDIRMPILSGDEAIKEMLKTNPSIKVIAQTAYAMSEDENKFLEMGFTDYISKPIKREVIFEKMDAIFNPS